MTKLLNAKEVAEILNTGITSAYKIIKELNSELIKKGYMVIPGKVNKFYLLERFGLDKNASI